MKIVQELRELMLAVRIGEDQHDKIAAMLTLADKCMEELPKLFDSLEAASALLDGKELLMDEYYRIKYDPELLKQFNEVEAMWRRGTE